jgi:PAS domain S-box-containing protein
MAQVRRESRKPSTPSLPLPKVPLDAADDLSAFDTPLLSQERFAQFFETFPHYCYVISPSGTILDVNPAACEALGYSEQELLGKPLSTIYAPESLPKMRVLFERWKQLGVIRDEEMVITTKQGQKRRVLLNARAVKDANGNLLHSTSVQIDITEQKQTQEKLRASEEHIREVVRRAPIAMVVTEGSEQRNVLINDRFTDLFGYTLDDVPDVSHWWPLAYPDADYRDSLKAEWKARVEKALRDRNEIEPMEAIVRCKDGSRRNIEFHFSALADISVISFIDVTDRKRAEAVLQQSEELFRLVANTAPVMIWMSGTDKLCNYFNSPWLEFTGRALEQELGNGWAEGVHPEDLPHCLETYTTTFDCREPFQMEYRLRRHDGEYRWIHDVGVPRFSTEGTFSGYIGSCIDITERKLAEEALSAVSGHILEAQDQERARIARELHDDINQRLALVAIELDRQQQNLQATADELRWSMATMTKQVSELATDIHAMSHKLHPAKLDSQGLAAAAEGFCRELAERQKVEIKFCSEAVPKKVPEAVSLCLFRVLQEALQNAVKHSGARHVKVSLVGSVNQISLTVCDRGRGFRPADVLEGGGLGLTSMRERLKLVGGEFSIGTEPPWGTIVRASAPLSSS